MSNIVLIGAQWGDEGKGKIIDVITERVDWVVRYQGGNNAGHTVEIGDEQYIVHLIPSGILRPGKKCVIGNGVVVDPMALMGELNGLKSRGIETEGRLFVSDRAHMVLPYHKQVDARLERIRSASTKIGTTQRGIGPAYGDKIGRKGLRMGELTGPHFAEALTLRIEESNRLLTELGGEPLSPESLRGECEEAARYLRPYITDTTTLLYRARASGDTILFEGAQGTMLDVDFGTYPYVTSSNATAGGACTGSGVPPHCMDEVIGVVKAYTTRVGEGPFPTELSDEEGRLLRDKGNEYGATTGRPRRCGWFDAVVARYAVMVNGVDSWAMTKLDVLDHCKTIKLCTGYEYNGESLDTLPADVSVLAACTPVYEEVEGWYTLTADVTQYDDLPDRAKAYVRRIETLTGVPVKILSIGPRRESTLVL